MGQSESIEIESSTMKHQSGRRLSFVPNNKENEYWRRQTRIVLTSSVQHASISMVQSWLASADKKMLKLWRSFDGPQSYDALTEYIEEHKMTWKDLHAFRQPMYDLPRRLLIINKGIAGPDGIVAKGSKDRGSDIDITTTENPVDVTIIMAYALGLFSMAIFASDDFGHIQVRNNVDDVIIWYLKRLSPLADIVCYSSNGVITAKDISGMCPTTQRYLLRIAPDLYQIVNKRSCYEQVQIFEVVTVLLLDRLVHDAAAAIGDFEDDTLHEFITKVNQYKATLSPDIERMQVEAVAILKQSPFVKFKTQIYSSHQADLITKDLRTKPCSFKGFCVLASEWERHQIMANIASPESAWSVSTFSTTVLAGQGDLGDTMIVQPAEYWSAFLENLTSTFHQLAQNDQRRAYKYAVRTQSAASNIFGQEINIDLSNEEYKIIRRGHADLEAVQTKLLNISMNFLRSVFVFAPASVTLKQSGVLLDPEGDQRFQFNNY
jgi:hypothetical protein